MDDSENPRQGRGFFMAGCAIAASAIAQQRDNQCGTIA
jgi:hypothetical protein